MKRLISVILLLVFASSMYGQKDKETPKNVHPVISLENQVKYFKALSNQLEAQLILERAQKQLDAASTTIQILVPAMTKDCGPGLVVQLTPEKDLICITSDK